MSATIHVGDALTLLRTLPEESVHCVVTSPPYWGLRDYGVDGQIGLEETFQEFLAKLVAVFTEVRRVLRKDGVCWVNMGDSYSTHAGQQGYGQMRGRGITGARLGTDTDSGHDLKPKDLLGQPWRLAFALQEAGWWLRSDCIWHKPNRMPESVTDRPTKAHEYVFLLTKSASYFYDAEAVRQRSVAGRDSGNVERVLRKVVAGEGARGGAVAGNVPWSDAGVANLRTVWTIPTQPYAGAHFATFPEELAARCIRAGTSERGCCSRCGAPLLRKVETSYERSPVHGEGSRIGKENSPHGMTGMPRKRRVGTTVGWQPGCECGADPVPCTVLDPFTGSGTTGAVAVGLGRSFVGCELSPAYAELARQRIDAVAPLFAKAVVR